MAPRIQLIVGLGNPGPQYEATRHNAGFWFVDEVAHACGGQLRSENKFHGEACKVRLGERDVWLLKPMTFMNRSGQSAAALARFYKIPVEEILVVHDELDLPPGALKLKKGGGHGGHNGLRDLIAQLGGKDFVRLRVGIGHPGHSSQVTGYVLTKPPASEREDIEAALRDAEESLPDIVGGELQKAMNRLHSR